jgi:PAS domain S-box-containing protein
MFLTGFKMEESLGQNLLILQGEQTDPLGMKNLLYALTNQQSFTIDLLTYRKDRSAFWNRISIHPQFEKPGEFSYILVSYKDVTEEKETSEKLKQAHHELEQIMEAVPDIIYKLDLGGNLVRWNQKLNKITGLTNEELKEKPGIHLFPESERGNIISCITEIIENGYAEVEAKIIRKDGSLVPYHWSAIPIKDENGKIIGVTGSGKDISERAQMRQDLLLAKQVQEKLLPPNIDNEYIKSEAVYQPHHFVSGDFYHFSYNTEKKILYGYIIDVMGHGISTALQHSALEVLFDQAFKRSSSLSKKLSWINHSIHPYVPEDCLTAAISFKFDFKNQLLSYASAGINHFVKKTNEFYEVVKVPGAFLGMMDNMSYEEHTIKFESGDEFFFLSDGMFELLCDESIMKKLNLKVTIKKLEELSKGYHRKDDCSAVMFSIK